LTLAIMSWLAPDPSFLTVALLDRKPPVDRSPCHGGVLGCSPCRCARRYGCVCEAASGGDGPLTLACGKPLISLWCGAQRKACRVLGVRLMVGDGSDTTAGLSPLRGEIWQQRAHLADTNSQACDLGLGVVVVWSLAQNTYITNCMPVHLKGVTGLCVCKCKYTQGGEAHLCRSGRCGARRHGTVAWAMVVGLS